MMQTFPLHHATKFSHNPKMATTKTTEILGIFHILNLCLWKEDEVADEQFRNINSIKIKRKKKCNQRRMNDPCIRTEETQTHNIPKENAKDRPQEGS